MATPKVKSGRTKIKQAFTKYVPTPLPEDLVAPKAKKKKKGDRG